MSGRIAMRARRMDDGLQTATFMRQGLISVLWFLKTFLTVMDSTTINKATATWHFYISNGSYQRQLSHTE